jgi:ribose transport system ATP-binding protein
VTLALSGIAKHFGATTALDGVDLDVAAGEVHAVIGENGAGKSTLLNILSGLVTPDAGTMRVADAPYAPRGPGDARNRGIAHIHQELSLCPHLTVAENIFLGAEKIAKRAGAARLLAEFGDINPRARCGDLSLADRQVVEICRALAWEARIILMDEPTSSLQRASVERLFATIRSLQARGISVVYISHFLEEVREIADRYTVLRDGRTVRGGELRDVTADELIAAMVGRPVETSVETNIQTDIRRASSRQSNVVLEVRDLAAPPRLRSATFDLRRGEILGIAGLIGSGRTDLIRTLFGLQRASAGRITARATFGYLSEDRKNEGLALPLSIADNVTMSRLDACARGGWINLRRQDAQTSDVIQRLRIKAAGPRARVFRLSGGNQQKVAFGRLLHRDPDILLLDEPARGVDIGSRSDIYREIVRLAGDGKAVLMVSSYLPELLAVCDRIAVMSRGRLSPARNTREWTADAIMEAAIGGAAA